MDPLGWITSLFSSSSSYGSYLRGESEPLCPKGSLLGGCLVSSLLYSLSIYFGSSFSESDENLASGDLLLSLCL
jgi:hypothetical protein